MPLLRVLVGAAFLLWGVSSAAKPATLIVAGGCFWCVEADFQSKPGVLEVVSGFTGGTVPNPSYELVSSHTTGHYEAVKITYEDSQVTLAELVDYYWHIIDPTDTQGQFCDKGSPYLSALFYQSPEQKQVFDQSISHLNANKPFKQPIATRILPASPFYPAEEYHQDYALKNPLRYRYYRWNCGRDNTIKQRWGSLVSPAH